MLKLNGTIKLFTETIEDGADKIKENILFYAKSFGLSPEEITIDNIGLDGDDFVKNYNTVNYSLHFKRTI
jgi:hypothetical protein